jgi:hypothetical protein
LAPRRKAVDSIAAVHHYDFNRVVLLPPPLVLLLLESMEADARNRKRVRLEPNCADSGFGFGSFGIPSDSFVKH